MLNIEILLLSRAKSTVRAALCSTLTQGQSQLDPVTPLPSGPGRKGETLVPDVAESSLKPKRLVPNTETTIANACLALPVVTSWMP